MKFHYKNNISSLNQLASDIENFANQNNVPPPITYALNLCLDEVLTNIISYSLKDQPQNTPIEMDLTITNQQIIATMQEPGKPFNPFTDSPHHADIQSNVKERPIGGLGIYFLEQYMDKVEYKRKNNHNIITLYKNIKPECEIIKNKE